ncbi:SDR family NAD(P)-dependent oxidoreductase [Candidatus Poriferisocius sp.]|uniref:SDR family NAD(P)-dependent oxidoreductase n=1 Tax=Candidatus Poriferisocius sp. TaxID=3101276 RepID=UPI003B029CA0
MRFSKKVALVTGAGSGIGRATAARMVSEGAVVVGSDISSSGLDETAGIISSSGLDETTGIINDAAAFYPVVSDVRSREACHELVDSTVTEHGHLDVLCNIAGVAGCHRVGDVDQSTWDQIMGVNVSGVFWMSQAALPHLESSGGCIVNMASNAGQIGQAYTVPYCASKAAVILITKAMAMETIRTPVRINAVAPGGVETNLVASFEFPADPDMELMGRYMGFRGMAQAGDIASAVAYLASDEAHRIHGAVLSVDAGLTAG